MNNIHILRKKLIKIKSNYIKKLHKADVDISLSSLSSFRPLNFSNFGKRTYQIKLKNIEKKINLINFIYQVKNFLYILRFSSPQIFGNYSKKNMIQQYRKNSNSALPMKHFSVIWWFPKRLRKG